jgi:hypothetical protein
MMHRPAYRRFTSSIWVFCVVAQSTLLCFAPIRMQTARAVPPSQTIFSEDAKGWLSFPNYQLMTAHFDKTQWGIVLQDPKMGPFRKQLRQQFNAQLATTENRLGVRINELSGVATGEIATAAFQWGGEKNLQRGFALIADITNNQAAAKQLLTQITQSLQKKGANISRISLAESAADHIKAELKDKNLQIRGIEYYLNAEILIATDHPLLLDDILARLKNPTANPNSLGKCDAFQTVQQQLDKAAPNLQSDAQWFVVPLDYAAIIRDANEEPRRRRRDRIKVLQRQGFDSVQAAGGRLGFAQNGLDSTMVSFIHSPVAKRHHAALALKFPPQGQLPPDQWVPHSAGSSSEVSWDIPFAFAQLKSLIDDWLDQPGYAEALLSEMAEDPRGLQIDLEKDLIAQMKGRISFSRSVTRPVSETSEKIVISIPLVNAAVLHKLLKARLPRDSGIKPHTTKGKNDVWELLPPKKKGSQIPRQGFGQRNPPQAANNAAVKRTINPGIAVVHGSFFYSSDWQYLADLVDSNWNLIQKLENSASYQRVIGELNRMSAGEQGGVSSSQFIDLAESYRINYEMIRKNKIAQSETFLVRLIRSFAREEEPGDEPAPKNRINGANLPSFDTIEGKFGLGGYRVYTRDDGWMIYGCVLPPLAALAPPR